MDSAVSARHLGAIEKMKVQINKPRKPVGRGYSIAGSKRSNLTEGLNKERTRSAPS
jgi:hypothetical protein